uniref:NB-ARC domain-containing protein n=1 Tax=Oryza glumipatula TaxID=40148 RepID=A0A0D9Y4L5_9ORYZ
MEGAMVSAVTGALNSLLFKLNDLLGSEHKSLKGLRGEIGFLESEHRSMNSMLRRLADMEEIDAQTKEWRDRVREMAYDIEDCIDLFVHHLGSLTGKAGVIKKMAWIIKGLQLSHRISGHIQELKARVMDESDRYRRYDTMNISSMSSDASGSRTRSVDPRLSALYTEAERLVGIDGPKDKIIKWLMDTQGGISRRLRTMAIVGAFVTVSQNPNVKHVLAKILSDVSGAIGGALADEHHLINKLREYLQDRRYFLVIDDIWDAQTWRIIECALVKNSQGSRIVTTTRINDIAKSCCCSCGDQVYEMKVLCATDSKRLFFRRIFNSDERCPPQLREAANNILRKCGGLPLAIISISSLLATKPKSLDQWDKVKTRINYTQENSPDIETMAWVLSLSYFDLPHHLKTCLMYLSIFPEDYVIKKERLIGRWIAEGFIHEKQGESLYEIGEDYFNELINRSLLQPVDIEDDGQVHACRVHDTILDFIVSRSNEENFVTMVGASDLTSTPTGKIRRLSFHKNSEGSVTMPAHLLRCHVRSLTTFLHAGQLQRLTHLLVDCHVKLPDGIGNMQALEELTGFSAFMYPSTFLQEIGKISSLRVLRVVWNYVDFQGNAETYRENLDISLTKLGTCYLESLSLDIHGHDEEDDFSLHLWTLAPCRLQKLYIGRWHPISRIPNWTESLANLQYLHIYVKRINQEDLRMLGSIPSLLTLYLFSDEAPEEKLTITSQGFQSLKFFKIHCYHMGLVFEAGSMAKLEYLHILISAFQVKSWDGSFDFGIQHLSCLTKVYAYINCYGLTAEEAEAAVNAIMVSVDTIPNCPKLQIDRRYAPL